LNARERKHYAMRRKQDMLKRIALIGLLIVPVGAWAFYKPVRVLAPEMNGVSCINDEICVEDIAKFEKASALYKKALIFVNSSVGEIANNPRTVFCSSESCFESFGFHSPAKAKTIGVYGIVVGPHGWNEFFMRHEMIHHLQTERLGVLVQWQSPKWFKEGMAYSLSEEPRKLKEPWASYRVKFENWHRGTEKKSFWDKAKNL